MKLKELVEKGHFNDAEEMILGANDYHDAEENIITLLEETDSPLHLVELAFEVFLVRRVHKEGKHGAWVHSLSHFVPILWSRRMTWWLKRFYKVAFRGALEFSDFNCIDSLVVSFYYGARFDDDPADFGILPEELEKMEGEGIYWEFYKPCIDCIKASPFISEKEFALWKLEEPEERLTRYDELDVGQALSLLLTIRKEYCFGERKRRELAALEISLLERGLESARERAAKGGTSGRGN